MCKIYYRDLLPLTSTNAWQARLDYSPSYAQEPEDVEMCASRLAESVSKFQEMSTTAYRAFV